MKKQVLLAYSGGLDTSVILKWLIEQDYDVYCYVADVGQQENFDTAKKNALMIGAKDVVIDDLKAEFVDQFIVPFIKTGATYEGKYLLGTALARPLIAKRLAKVAVQKGITTIAHGATGKGNDQVRFELALHQLLPSATLMAPWRDPIFLAQFQGRKDLLAYAVHKQIPVESTTEKPFSTDANLMHISYEGGLLEDPMNVPPADMFQLTQSPEMAPDTPCDLTVHFHEGAPKKIEFSNGHTICGPMQILQTLNELAGEHGVGRIDIVESRLLGMKSRGVYETPGATVLAAAHHDLECLTLDREVMSLKDSLKPKIATLIYDGLWFSPEFNMLMQAIEHSQKQVCGSVKVRLYKGGIAIRGRTSAQSLYNPQLASMDTHDHYNPQDATGFIRLHSLRLTNRAQ